MSKKRNKMHPILFSIGTFELRVYGLLTAIAFLTAIYFASILAKKKGYNPDVVFDVGLVIIICSVVGARALYVAVWWKYYAANWLDIFKVWEGGLVFYGGLICAVTGGIIWLKIKKIPVLPMADILIPFLALAHAIGRIGCYFNGCCYGAVNEHYGVIFPAIGDNLRHLPTQLYESALNFLNFVLLLLFFRNTKRKSGDVFFVYLINYGVIRIIMELFRGDPERGKILFMSTSTFISLFLLAAGIGGLLYSRFSGKRKSQQ
jgi:phosphatidylglycerol---prolipoprotein diacylglyceryl transferase